MERIATDLRRLIYEVEDINGGPEVAARQGAQPSPPLGMDASFLSSRLIIQMISHVIEDQIITGKIPAVVHSGFQRLSLLEAQQERYRQMLHYARGVYVYGIKDWEPWTDPKLTTVSIGSGNTAGLERFWFIISVSPSTKTALLAEQISPGALPEGKKRDYRGFWTFNADIVAYLVEILEKSHPRSSPYPPHEAV